MLITEAFAATPEPSSMIATNFLTEADLNSWFVKIMAALAIPILLQLVSLWRESKNDTSKDIKDLKIQIHEIKLLVAEMRGEARTIARNEAERVVELYERARR